MDSKYEYIPIGENEECPTTHEYLIDKSGECSVDCNVEHQGVFNGTLNKLYELNKICYEQCPDGTDIVEDTRNNIYKCKQHYNFYCRSVEYSEHQ